MATKKTAKQPALEEFLHFGLGLASLAKDQLETVASSLMSDGKLLMKDRKKFQREVTAKGKALYAQLQKDMKQAQEVALNKLDVPTRKEFEALKRQVSKRSNKK